MKAYWRKGYHGKIDATVAATELDKIKDDNGGVLTAGIVVQKAKSKRSKLHPAFEWDDAKAADEFRLNQARNMMNSIEVVYPEHPKQRPVRKYHVVTEKPKMDQPARKVYQTTREIMQDPIMRDEVLANAIREALSFRRKYAELQELAGVFAALDEFIQGFDSSAG